MSDKPQSFSPQGIPAKAQAAKAAATGDVVPPIDDADSVAAENFDTDNPDAAGDSVAADELDAENLDAADELGTENLDTADDLDAEDDSDGDGGSAGNAALPPAEGQEQQFVVPPNLRGQRADKVLAVACPQFSRERLQESFEAGVVFLEGQSRPLAKKTRVNAGDVLRFTLPKPITTGVHPVGMELEILYEDADLVAVNKPVGLVVHPGAGVADAATLVHGMLHHCGGVLAMAGGAERPGIVHRLDRDTSGTIVLAKSDAAYYALVRSFAERHTRKIYWALVRRAPAEDSGTIKLPIGRHPTARHKMAVREDGRFAHTDWRVLERFKGGYALIECHIHTGRTHQIRVHLNQLGSPIWGDKTYGYRAAAGDTKVPEQFLLHARELELPHPVSGEPLLLRAEPSEHFTEHLGWLRGR